MEPSSTLRFIKELEHLKNVTRTAWTSAGKRESTAEHSWRLALFAGVMLADYPELDAHRVLMMALVHDLGELYSGDVSALLSPDAAQKYAEEALAVNRLFSLLDEPMRGYLLSIWQEYEEGKTPEARLVKALDKAETILQHNQGENPPDFNYEFNLTYGKPCFAGDEILCRIREMLDAETARHTGGNL